MSRKDPLKEETATHSSILAGKIPRTEEPGRLVRGGHRKVGHDLATKQQQLLSLETLLILVSSS